MSVNRPFAKRYRSLVIASLISGGSLLNLLPALADQNSATPGDITNQATAEFQDAIDDSKGQSVSNTVKVTVVEVAGISITGSFSGTPIRGKTITATFKIYNSGNDPSKIFVPETLSSAKVGGVNATVGTLKIVKSTTATGTDTLIGTNVPTGGVASPSIAPGSYITVEAPVTIPQSASNTDELIITLGNQASGADIVNEAYTDTTSTTRLHTKDNDDNTFSDTTGTPFNGEREASKTIKITIATPTISVSGKVWDDYNNSANNTFTSLVTTSKNPAVTTGTPLYAFLIDSTGKVLAKTAVDATAGTYTLSALGSVGGQVSVVISSNNTISVGDTIPTNLALPTGWTATTPQTYTAFDFDIVDVTQSKDFGIDKLPTADNVDAGNQTSVPNVKYAVPTLTGADFEDITISKFRIPVLPDAATVGTFYYNNVAITTSTIITYPGLLTFDPVDGSVNLSVNYVAIDAGGKESTVPATITMGFNANTVSISGKVWHDKNADGLFAGDSGTDGRFGTSIEYIYAILVDITTGKVVQSQQVSSTTATMGEYTFVGISPALSSLKVIISTTAGTNGNAPPTAVAPTGWVATTATQTASFATNYLDITGKEFGIRQKAKVLLLKRITQINTSTTNDGINLSAGTTDNYNVVGTTNWPTTLKGAEDGGKVKPGDEIEYTIYFINNQGSAAKNVKLCDPILGTKQTFVNGSIKLYKAGDTTGVSVPDTAHYAAGSAPTDCNLSGVTGGTAAEGIAIPVTDATFTSIPGATSAGTPTDSYGYFKFRTKVKP
jgi:uncharacterized repeat protein (TIGR01451 family)